MARKLVFAAFSLMAMTLASVAQAECTGGNGRGWSKGKGNGSFEMSGKDGSCRIGYPSFIYESENRSVPATETTLTRAPKSGKISLTKDAIVYTPAAGFTGKDKFCIKNTAKGEKGTLSGCVTIKVN